MIGIAINSILTGSTALTNLVGSKIYPYAIDEGELLPAVIFSINSVQPQYEKGGVYWDEAIVEVASFDYDYKSCVSISEAVRGSLENYKGTVSSVEIVRARVSNISEAYDFDTNTFISKISFNLKINK